VTKSIYRKFTALILGACATLAVGAPGAAIAQVQSEYPSRPITLVVPYPAGGATDTLARFIGGKLQESWGQSVVIQNKPGASGIIGAQHVSQAAADGYTVLVGVTSMIQQPAMMSSLPYDPLKDFAPVVQTAHTSNLFLVPRNSPAKTMKEFVALAKSNPGAHNFASWGPGSSAHIHGELLNQQANLDLTHIPFQGSAPVITNLMGGQISSAFVDIPSATPHLKSLQALAVTGPVRIPGLPDVPTFTELGYKSFEPRGWHGLFLPAATPDRIVQKLSAEINRILRLPDTEATIQALGMIRGGGTPEEFAAAMRKDAAIYAEIIKEAGIRM
jgi:tripartite-type tricarboxylate transporter receptor subunit TctC